MDSSKIQQFLLLGKSTRGGRAVAELINSATAEPGLFTFGELLDLPAVQEMTSSPELAGHHRLLQIFCYGTWPDYKSASTSGQPLPPLTPQQQHKLKQLTAVSLAAAQPMLPYDTLRAQLDIPSVRELEDFLITECFYRGLIAGKLDQAGRRLVVSRAAARDVRPEALPHVAAGLEAWIEASERLMAAIEAKVAYTATTAEAARRQREALEARVEDTKKTLKTELEARAGEGGGDDLFDAMDTEDRLGTSSAAARPKRRR